MLSNSKRALYVLIGCLAIYGLWSWTFPSGSWRYRLTYEINTPEGLKTGTGVIQVSAQRSIYIGDGPSGHASVRGEAVSVDLGGRGILFSVLRSKESPDYAVYVVFKAFPWVRPDGQSQGGELSAEGIAYYSSLEAKAELSNDQLPMLVRFRDGKDPKTIEIVRPDELFRFFGNGVSLRRVTIEMTRDPITTGIIEGLLPPYGPETGFYQWYRELRFDDPRRLTKDDFIR